MPLTIKRRYEPAYVHALDDEQEPQEEDEEPWYTDILNYVTRGEYPPNTDKRARRALRLLASQYVLIRGELHKRTAMGKNLLCIVKKKAH